MSNITDVVSLGEHPTTNFERDTVRAMIAGQDAPDLLAEMLGFTTPPEPVTVPVVEPQVLRGVPYPDRAWCKQGRHEMDHPGAWTWVANRDAWTCWECRRASKRAYESRNHARHEGLV